MLSNKTWGDIDKGTTAQDLAGHQSVGGEQWFSFASLVCLEFYLSLFVIFLFITIYYYY